jgi:hypothetical protein
MRLGENMIIFVNIQIVSLKNGLTRLVRRYNLNSIQWSFRVLVYGRRRATKHGRRVNTDTPKEQRRTPTRQRLGPTEAAGERLNGAELKVPWEGRKRGSVQTSRGEERSALTEADFERLDAAESQGGWGGRKEKLERGNRQTWEWGRLGEKKVAQKGPNRKTDTHSNKTGCFFGVW